MGVGLGTVGEEVGITIVAVGAGEAANTESFE
jgi:hypothetical protein